MEENNAQVLEETTPTEPAEAETQEETTAEPSDTGAEGVNEEAADTANAGTDSGTEAQTNEEPTIKVRFNHEDRVLSHAEAVTLAQKGLKYDSMAEMLNQISYLAAIQDKTPAELIKGYIEAGEDLKRRELVEKYGEDDEVIEVLMEKFKNENQKKFTAVTETSKQREAEVEQNLNRKIAEDFAELKKDFPELREYGALPVEVQRAAASGTPIKYAYLEYKYAQEKQVNAAKAQAEAAAKKSAGSMASTPESKNSAVDEMLRGLWK